MPSSYSASPIFRVIGAAVTTLVNGDPVNRNNLFVEASPGGTPNLTLGYLLDVIDGILTLHPIAGTGTRSAAPIFLSDTSTTAYLSIGVGQAPASSAAKQAFEPPHGRPLVTVSLFVDPYNASPPAGTSVQGEVWKVALATGVETQIGTTTTDPTTGTDYGDPHSFDVDCTGHTVDRTAYSYYIKLIGETGSGSASCQLNGSTYRTT